MQQMRKVCGLTVFTSEKEMLQSVDCDAVYIGTPVSCHFEQAMLALKYGKHVFVEKPDYFYAERAVQVQEVVDKIYVK